MKEQLTNLRGTFRSDFRSVAWDLLRAVPLRAARLATVTDAHCPVELKWVSCALLVLLALAWPAHGADLDLLGQWPGWPRGTAGGVAVSGNYAYVADGGAGLQVIDMSDPANPQGVGGYDTSGYGVVLSGNYAYVADGGLQVIDVSNPANPQWVGGYETSGSAVGVVLNGNYAYVADSPWGLMILGPRTPRITAITRAAGTATVHYTNTIPGTNYTLEFRTNLTTGTWQPVGTQPAPGDSASQTDSAAPGDQRYYRVSYGP